MVIPLIGCDLVLGVQWLRTLGPIVWDFIKLSMQFTIQEQQFTLYGVKAEAIRLATRKQATKLGNTAKGTCTLLLTSIIQKVGTNMTKEGIVIPSEVQLLLTQYAKLFAILEGLPLLKRHDHKIRLSDET